MRKDLTGALRIQQRMDQVVVLTVLSSKFYIILESPYNLHNMLQRVDLFIRRRMSCSSTTYPTQPSHIGDLIVSKLLRPYNVVAVVYQNQGRIAVSSVVACLLLYSITVTTTKILLITVLGSQDDTSCSTDSNKFIDKISFQ